MELQLYDYRNGRTPREEVQEYFESKGYLRTSKSVDHESNVVDVYHIQIDSISVGRAIEELKERYDIMITDTMFGVDTKGYRFKQR